jgi:hypothetical protein
VGFQIFSLTKHSYLAVLLSKLVGLTSGEDKYTPLPDLVDKVASDTYTISASEVQKLTPDGDPVLDIFSHTPISTVLSYLFFPNPQAFCFIDKMY